MSVGMQDLQDLATHSCSPPFPSQPVLWCHFAMKTWHLTTFYWPFSSQLRHHHPFRQDFLAPPQAGVLANPALSPHVALYTCPHQPVSFKRAGTWRSCPCISRAQHRAGMSSCP